jgi:phospholipid/cholesterol/gamma-HCH transport system substrate-binding protein
MLKHRARDRMYKRAVGLLVVCSLVLVLLVIRSFGTNERFLGRSFQLQALVPNVYGLEADAKVTMAGLKVGRVQAIDLLPDKTARLTLNLEQRYHDLVRSDSVATLTKPLIGTAVVDIGIGTPTLPRLENGATIALLVKPDLSEVVATLPQRLERVDRALDNLVAITDLTRGSVQRITGPTGALETTLAEAQASARNVRAATDTLRGALTDVRAVAVQSQAAVGQVQTVLTDVRALTQHSAAMGQTLQRTLTNAEEITGGLRQLVPTLGTSLQAAQNAADEADAVLRAAGNSFLLGGPKPIPAAPTLASPRAP